MPATEAQKKAARKWNETNVAERYDQLKILVDKGEKLSLKKHALEQEETLTDFVKRAIKETLERDKSGETIKAAEEPAINRGDDSLLTLPIEFREDPEETIREYMERAIEEKRAYVAHGFEFRIADLGDSYNRNIKQHLERTGEGFFEFLYRAIYEVIEFDKEVREREKGKPKMTLEELHRKYPRLADRHNAGVVVEERKKKVIKKKAANEMEYKDGFSVQDEGEVEKKRDPKREEGNKRAWAAAERDEDMNINDTRVYRAEDFMDDDVEEKPSKRKEEVSVTRQMYDAKKRAEAGEE